MHREQNKNKANEQNKKALETIYKNTRHLLDISYIEIFGDFSDISRTSPGHLPEISWTFPGHSRTCPAKIPQKVPPKDPKNLDFRALRALFSIFGPCGAQLFTFSSPAGPFCLSPRLCGAFGPFFGPCRIVYPIFPGAAGRLIGFRSRRTQSTPTGGGGGHAAHRMTKTPSLFSQKSGTKFARKIRPPHDGGAPHDPGPSLLRIS